MRRVSLLATASILASLLVSGPVATTAPALAATDSPVRTTVAGIITDAVTGDPVASACISLYRANTAMTDERSHRLAVACTDAAGAYRLLDIPLGYPHFAYIEAPGYGGQWFPGHADMMTGQVFPGSSAPNGRDFAIQRATAALTLHLTRQDGSPAQYASVTLMSNGGTLPSASMRTDANGDVTRTGLPAGDYKVRVGGAGYAIQFYPGKTAAADGQTVTLVAGQTVSLSEQFLPVDPMPTPQALMTVSGTVRTPSGSPIAGATVTAKASSSPTVFGTTTSAADGTYTMSIPNANGLIKISAAGYATVWNTDDPQPVQQIAVPGVHDFVLRPGSGTIRGTLTDSVPGPIPAFTSMTIIGADSWYYSFASVGYDGTFEVPNIPAGTYTLSFTPPGRVNQQIPNVVVRDGEVTTADAQLTTAGGVRVRVMEADASGHAIAGATVTAYSDSTGAKVKVTDADGWVEFGDYGQSTTVTLTATHKPYHHDARTLQASVRAGSVTTVEMRMQAGATLAVPVRNADPAYPICADLLGLGPLDDWTQSDCETPKNGVVTYGPLPAGSYHAFLRPTNRTVAGSQWVSGSGGTGDERSATVVNLAIGSQTTAPEQRLGAAGSITGKATDPATKALVTGCVQVTRRAAPFGAMNGCSDGSGVYRLDGLGPYAWPLFFQSTADQPHGSIWSGGATSRLDAQPVKVTGGATTTYNFASTAAVWFGVTPPASAASPNSWSVNAYDARTGDLVGTSSPFWSNIGPGPKLLRIAYTTPDGGGRECWMRRTVRLRDDRPTAVYYGGPPSRRTPVSVAPGQNCFPEMPPTVQPTASTGSMKAVFPDRAAPRAESQPAGAAAPSFAAPSFAAPSGETFNDLVRNNFEAALQLALGALPS